MDQGLAEADMSQPHQFDPGKPVVALNGEWFDLGNCFERECHARGRHKWGKDRYAGDDGDGGPDLTQGYHHCLHCFRIEPL